MALTNEDLLAISQLLDTKLDARLQPIENQNENSRHYSQWFLLKIG